MNHKTVLRMAGTVDKNKWKSLKKFNLKHLKHTFLKETEKKKITTVSVGT